MKDDILLEIDRKREREELLLPARRFAGENRKYLTLGVFKKSPKRVKSVPCPNGCGVSVKGVFPMLVRTIQPAFLSVTRLV